MFEMQDNSMNNGLSNAIVKGDILTVREIPSNLWKSNSNRLTGFIIVVCEEMNIVGKVLKYSQGEYLTLIKLNPDILNIRVRMNNIKTIFAIIQITRIIEEPKPYCHDIQNN